jgi:GT2 family glycosyltransferase
MSAPRITALLVVHDGATWLPEVVASLASQSVRPNQVFAIDTGSLDSSVKLLKGARIPVASIDRESGFGAAIAHGISQLPALIKDSDEWIWILHDDCVLHPQALESLLAAIANRPSVVMAGPKLLGWHDRTHLIELGISIATNGARWTGLEPSEYDQGQHDGVKEVLSVSTAGALIRRDVFEELGGFDQNLELFRDDVDFGWRVRVAGHSVIAVSDAIGYHAQASATERRSVDVHGAFLHRPLLLDRRNAAYVLLANSSAWSLPGLVIQLFTGALLRSIGYLFAKLPGYASDEILAIGSLIIHPAELLSARKARKKLRLISPGVVKTFIPSRTSQLRASFSRFAATLRTAILPDSQSYDSPIVSDLEIDEDEDLLTPISRTPWKSVFYRPLVIAATVAAVVSLAWARNRFGSLSGGALAESPASFLDLIKLYISSWHDVGMGSGQSTPVWVLAIGLASLITFGNVSLFITLFFLAAPFILLLSAHAYLRKFTDNSWLSAGASFLYAFSPVAISSINSGRLGVLVLLALLPFLIRQFHQWPEIDRWSWRSIFTHGLFLWFLFAFNPIVLLMLIGGIALSILADFKKAQKNHTDPLFRVRLVRRLTLLGIPFLLAAPSSFGILMHPSRVLREIGLAVPGGGPNLAFLANPGGPGALPWWCISPVVAILLIAYFSTTAARKFAQPGITFLLCGTLLSVAVTPGNGTPLSTQISVAAFISIATLFSLTSGVVMFDKIRSRLEQSHINFRHVSVAVILAITLVYSATTLSWLVSAGANSPLQTGGKNVLPAYLSIETSAKSLVLRPYINNGEQTLSYYISRGRDVTLGEPDVAPTDTAVISQAVEGLIDNTGVSSSKVLATYGIKYVFLKNPIIEEVVQTIDGLGGFTRTSATKAGIVWKVSEPTGRLILTDYAGTVSIIDNKGITAIIPRPGTLTLTETFSNGWKIYQEGFAAARIENSDGLPTFEITNAGEVTIFHDGRQRRAWISFFVISLVTVTVLALPAGRRKREISERELA